MYAQGLARTISKLPKVPEKKVIRIIKKGFGNNAVIKESLTLSNFKSVQIIYRNEISTV